MVRINLYDVRFCVCVHNKFCKPGGHMAKNFVDVGLSPKNFVDTDMDGVSNNFANMDMGKHEQKGVGIRGTPIGANKASYGFNTWKKF